MDLLALVLVNIVFGFVLYYIISIKLTNSVRDYQNTKIKKEIVDLSLEFYKESDNYLALMDSRINSLKNLLQKAESLGIDFDKIEDKKFISKPDPTITKNKIYNQVTETKTKEVREKDDEESQVGNFFANLGKGVKSVLGMDEQESNTKNTVSKNLNQSFNLRVSGNPLLDENFIEDQNENVSFKSTLRETKKNTPSKIEDKIYINAHTALKEVPESSSKIEKVVHLLKKGFTHLEISDATGLAIPEISLIETIKIEKTRRF